MSVLDSFYGVIYGTLLVIVSLKAIILLQNFINIIKSIRMQEEKIERLRSKRINIKEISALDNYEYILFCQDYFKGLGYEDFALLNNNTAIKDVICRRENKNILLRCIKLSVDSEEILDFIGAMIKNNIYEGLVVYSGKIDSDVIKIVKKNKYSITFVHLEEIMKMEANKDYNIIESLI